MKSHDQMLRDDPVYAAAAALELAAANAGDSATTAVARHIMSGRNPLGPGDALHPASQATLGQSLQEDQGMQHFGGPVVDQIVTARWRRNHQ